MSKKQKEDIKDIVIDADHILFSVTESKQYKDGFEDDDCGKALDDEENLDMKLYKDHFKRIVDEYVLTAEVEAFIYGWKLSGKVMVILSDHKNFRYEVYDKYKAKRPPSPPIRKKLKKWAMKKYMYVKNTEADDIVAYHVRNGAIGFTTDKDLFKGVYGIWYNAHYMHKCWYRTSKRQAELFFKMQVLAGDGVDGIPSIPKVGLITAEKLLDKYGYEWDDILKIFIDKGFDKEYMVQMTRLVAMNQWTPKHGVRLWKFPKNKHTKS